MILLFNSLQVMFGVPFGYEIDMWSFGCILAEVHRISLRTLISKTAS